MAAAACHRDLVSTRVISDVAEQYYTLLGVRPDGVASVVDLVAAESPGSVRTQAEAMLREHLSCDRVEVWRDGTLLEQLSR